MTESPVPQFAAPAPAAPVSAPSSASGPRMPVKRVSNRSKPVPRPDHKLRMPTGHLLGKKPPSEKKFVPLLLLCIFLFFAGAHRFYAGKKQSAVLMLVLSGVSVVAFWVALMSAFKSGHYSPIPLILAWLCAASVWIWGITDLIVIISGNFKDTQGNAIRIARHQPAPGH